MSAWLTAAGLLRKWSYGRVWNMAFRGAHATRENCIHIKHYCFLLKYIGGQRYLCTFEMLYKSRKSERNPNILLGYLLHGYSYRSIMLEDII